MQQVFSLHNKSIQKASPCSNQQVPVQEQLFSLYESRLKSLMGVVKVYQETLVRDNEEGGLSFMNSSELATYRVDREHELLKDVLLSEKQRLVIKALTSYHQIKRENDQLKLQSASSSVKTSYNNKTREQMAAEKDVISNNRTSIDKESRISKGGETNCNITANQFVSNRHNNSNSRITVVSQTNQGNSASISVYERLLQEKLGLIKELDKKNRQLTLENEQNLHKIVQLQGNLEKQLKEDMGKKQCQQCLTLKEINIQMMKKFETLKQQNQTQKLRLKQEESAKRTAQGQNQLKELKLQELTMRLQGLQRELALKQEQEQQYQKQIKPQPSNNSQLIAQLKQKLLIQEQQLMVMTNSFTLLKEDISESLQVQVKRLKNSHLLLKEQIKTQIQLMKKEVFGSINEIITAVRMKSEGIRVNEEIAKKLRQIDNELDYFIEQRHIKV